MFMMCAFYFPKLVLDHLNIPVMNKGVHSLLDNNYEEQFASPVEINSTIYEKYSYVLPYWDG